MLSTSLIKTFPSFLHSFISFSINIFPVLSFPDVSHTKFRRRRIRPFAHGSLGKQQRPPSADGLSASVHPAGDEQPRPQPQPAAHDGGVQHGDAVFAHHHRGAPLPRAHLPPAELRRARHQRDEQRDEQPHAQRPRPLGQPVRAHGQHVPRDQLPALRGARRAPVHHQPQPDGEPARVPERSARPAGLAGQLHLNHLADKGEH